MNQWIKINYKPEWKSNSNYWSFWFGLNDKTHREKAPSVLNSYGSWIWWFHYELQKSGRDFDWSSK